jgi:PAS domain S-box-containing protein
MTSPRFGLHSLRLKIALTSILVEVVMLGLLITNSVSIATHALEKQTRFRISEIVPLLNASIASPLVERDYATLDEILLQVVRKEGIEYIGVEDAEGNVVSEVGLKGTGHERVSASPRPHSQEGDYNHVDFPILLVGQTVGELHFSINTHFLHAAIQELQREGLFIASGEVILTCVLLVLVGVLLTRNLAILAGAARTLADGDLSVRIHSRARDEIGAVSRAFDTMAERLESLYASLKASEKRYHTLTDVSPVGIFHTDNAGLCVFINERMSDITGLPREAFLGQAWEQRIYEEDRQQVLAEWYDCLQAGRSYAGEFRMVRATGEPVWVYVQAVQLRGDNGEVTGYVGTVTDISRRKRTEQDLALHRDRLGELVAERTAELEAMQKRLLHQQRLATLGQLTATVSHELRNPLGVIGNAVYYLKRKLGGGDTKVAQYLDMIEREVAASSRIISDLLETTRTKDPILQWVNLDKELQSLLEEWPLPAGIRWRYIAHPRPFYLRADSQQLRQMLHNLILNAVQALGNEGKVELEVYEGADGYELRLSDNGPGIAPEQREQIFEPLFTTKAKGNGLGLWISREMARRHGGELSLCQGHLPGACFLIRLPRGGREGTRRALNGVSR